MKTHMVISVKGGEVDVLHSSQTCESKNVAVKLAKKIYNENRRYHPFSVHVCKISDIKQAIRRSVIQSIRRE